MNIVLDYAAGPFLTKRVQGLADDGLTVEVCPPGDSPRFQKLLSEAEALWHVIDPVTATVMETAPHLRLIQKIGVGVNTIDLETARHRRIAVCNMPGTNSQAVAEMTLLLMLSTLRRLRHLDQATRDGHGWTRPSEWQDDVGELAGKTVGLVGYGAVPSRLAPMLHAIGAHVSFTALTPKPGALGTPRDLATLLGESDIVSLHLPLTATTTHLLDRKAIARMKSGAVLINTARGALVDEHDLAEALRHGHLAAAGLDVFEDEPVSSSPLFALSNVTVTPHVAWLTQETLERSLAVATENCRRLVGGEDLLHRIV